ncbi:MAG TPA: DNA recombination protein RmuC [Gaiellaceae bacterium]|nr:DNA recombination protein RmuC [Gaiellaceae bacterium]
MSAIYLLVGLALGAGAVWLWARAALSSREAALDRERTLADEKLALLERTDEEWSNRIKAVAGAELAKSQTSLLALAGKQLDPIRETLDKFEAQARLLEERRLKDVSAVGEQLKNVVTGQERLRTETGNLVTALRAPHVRGRWGEMQLRRVVELAGMVSYCDFVEQASSRTDDGQLLRPDLLVRLPGNKTIVVDAKVPFRAYMDAINTDDADQKKALLQEHSDQVREHIAKLGQKKYWRQFENTPEFVVMFVDEGLYRAALDQDGSLIEAGAENGVIVASPATLIALLRTVAHGWQQEQIAENARKIASLGRELYERVGVFAGHFAKVGRNLDTAVGAFNQAVSSFESRLLVTARQFPEHGISADEPTELHQIDRKPSVVNAPELVALPPAESDAA